MNAEVKKRALLLFLLDFFVLLYLLVIALKILFERVFLGKRHPSFLQRLGWRFPHSAKPTIWIHAVSVGEVKSAGPFFRKLKEKYPDHFFLITTTTQTGQEEARRSLQKADAFAFLPLDLSFVVSHVVKKVNPTLFVLVESDFWFNLLFALKKNGTKTILVSGKVSEKSAKRFQSFPRLSQKLFSTFDQICVQNEVYRQRFLPLVSDPKCLHVTGNLKLDIEEKFSTNPISILPFAITISCTHDPEEELLLDALIDSPWPLILAPRHPERFETVAKLLQRKKIPYSRWSEGGGETRVLLVDAMGELPSCYAKSRLAIVGGSYVPKIGGHNVLEPCLYGTPVFFGPYMHNQTEFAEAAIESGAGCCVKVQELRKTIDAYFSDPQIEQKMRLATVHLRERSGGSTEKTLKVLKSIWE